MKLNLCLLLGCLAICQPSLAQFVIPDGTTTIPDDAFYRRTDLTNVVIPDSVTNIGRWAFADCTNLTCITVGKGLATIGEGAFTCMAYTDWYYNPGGFPLSNAVSVCFTGNAPRNIDAHAFDTWTVVGSSGGYVPCNVTVYYLSGTTGWGTTLADRPTVCLGPTRISNLNPAGISVSSSSCQFTIIGIPGTTVVIEACTNMASPVWFPVEYSLMPPQTNFMLTSTQTVFYDDHNNPLRPTRFYRVRQHWP